MDLLSDLGVKWTVADEGILANSIQKEFTRDFEGNLEDPLIYAQIISLKEIQKQILFLQILSLQTW